MLSFFAGTGNQIPRRPTGKDVVCDAWLGNCGQDLLSCITFPPMQDQAAASERARTKLPKRLSEGGGGKAKSLRSTTGNITQELVCGRKRKMTPQCCDWTKTMGRLQAAN